MAYRNRQHRRPAAIPGGAVLFLSLATLQAARATTLDDIGITQLRSFDPTLIGTGVSVAQAEFTTYSNPNDPAGNTLPYDPQYDSDNYQVNPAIISAPPLPGITYRGKIGTTPTTTYTPALQSSHATLVAQNYFATGSGAAPGITAVVNYNSNYFYNTVVLPNAAMAQPLAPVDAPPVSVVNMSFVYTGASSNTNASNFINQMYDNYVQSHGTIMVAGVGNGGGPQVPATAFNVIAVGAYPGLSSVGPTSGVSPASDGRSKPDITVSAEATSYSTPYVSGMAALMVQSGALGRGGAGTQSLATDARTIKALLLNGATKPAGWTHSSAQPLDFTWGAGIANAYNSYQNLAAGRKLAHTVNSSQTPLSGTNAGPEGWDLATISSGNVAHYFIDLSGANSISSLTSSLVWWRPAGNVTTDGQGKVTGVQLRSINNLDLMLYNFNTGTLVDSSVSTVDNVEHIFKQSLAPGRYDLQVTKAPGGSTATETYALAFNVTGGGVILNVDGTFDLHGTSPVVGGITGSGSILNSLGGVTSVLEVNGTSTFNGTLAANTGPLALLKSTGGTLTLTQPSTYGAGTTITGGTLLLTNTTGSATGTGGVTLNGGTLGGSGIVSGAVTAGSGPHTIAPSATLVGNTARTLSLGSLTTNANTTLAFNLATPGAASVNDVIKSTGPSGLTLNGGSIILPNTSTGPTSLGYYKIIQHNGFTGSLANIALPAVQNNIKYTLDATHDAGFIDIHRGYLGDANDNGTVEFNDFLLLSQNFGQAGGWNQGNFLGTPTIDFNNFLVLSQHFGETVGGSSLVSEADLAAFRSASAAFLAGAGIPEPASLALLGAGLLTLTTTRRRKTRC